MASQSSPVGLVNGTLESAHKPSNYFPVDNSLESFWFEQRHELDDHRSSASLPTQSDIVIIGAGYAGIATAYHLLKEDIGDATITIFEARGACSGATGRNGGHLRPDLYGHIPNYMDRAGVEAGAEIAEFEIANLWAIKKVIEDEEIDCDFTLTRSVDVWCNDEAARTAKATYDKLAALQLNYMKDVFFTSNPKQAEGYSGVKGAKAAGSYTAGTLWPYKFILSILKTVLSTGRVNLQTYTPVSSITPNDQHGFSIETQRGTVFAQRVVHASNAYVSGLLPEYDHSIIPCKGICCHITVPDGSSKSTPLLNNSSINRTEDKTLSYLIPRTDGSIIVGGAAAKFFPLRAQWYRNVDDSVLIDAAKDYYNGYMQRTYRGWEDSGARVSKIWSGVMGYSFDSNPHIGAVPARSGQYIIAGFNGHGMPVIWLASKGLAKMLAADRKGQKISFRETGIPRLFQTTQARVDRARNSREEDGDILGSGKIFLPAQTKPV